MAAALRRTAEPGSSPPEKSSARIRRRVEETRRRPTPLRVDNLSTVPTFDEHTNGVTTMNQKQKNPIAVAHSRRGGAGAGTHERGRRNRAHALKRGDRKARKHRAPSYRNASNRWEG